jgi:tRNA-dihydrouridine synthase
LPISVKTRLGFEWEENLIRFAKWLENAWASLITVHGRTTKQAYTWFANLDPIYELKKHLKIPLICNGDIKNYEDGMRKVRDLDWFMIGRATFWNPWCFMRESEKSPLIPLDKVGYLGNNEVIQIEWSNIVNGLLHSSQWQKWKFINWQYFPTLSEILEIMFFHATKLMETKWERKWSLEIRKHLVCYLSSFPWVKAYRKRLVTVESLQEVEDVINLIKVDFREFLGVIPGEIII